MSAFQEQQKGIVAKRVIDHLKGGRPLPDAPTGEILESFEPLQVAYAIEQEMQRCALLGWTKISVHMDVMDAYLLAKFLRGEK